ncbi:MAG: hypothetical protein IKZ21_06820 [Clostridia bacterium]|nr:hypothetical protein [Clostridia bacterium]
MALIKHRFSVSVDCPLPGTPEGLFEDHGFLMLPNCYTETGTATRLVINCHGAGGTVTTDDSQVEHQALTQYLVANGYAVMDVNGLPARLSEEQEIDIRNNIGSPIATQSYVAAYRYCMDHFNLKPEVFVHGGSMGGISSTNLVLSGAVPVLAHSAFCPVLDTYEEIFLHPWSDGLPKIALGKFYGLDTDANGNYLYDAKKIGPNNPATNPKVLHYPVPVKFWQCEDDEIVSFDVTRRFVEKIAQNGGNATLRAFPHGGHEPQLVGPAVKNPIGLTEFNGEEIPITPAVEETFAWIRSFDR